MINRSASLIFIRLTFFFSFFGFFTLNLIARHGLFHGLILAVMGWSAYVMCLPFFGGGIVFYPFAKIIGKWHDHQYELLAWAISVVGHIIAYNWFRSVYYLTHITHFLAWGFAHPFPYWGIFILNFLPIVLIGIRTIGYWPYGAVQYYQLRLALISASLAFLWYVAMHDLIILTNIHG